MEQKEPEIVNIVFGSAGLYLPKSKEWIAKVRKLLDLLEEDIEETAQKKVRSCKPQSSPQDSATPPEPPLIQEYGVESLPERKDGAIASIPQGQLSFKSELILKFEYDKKAEKSYDNLFIFETEDGRVALSYMSSKLYTTKAAVLRIPFPVPQGYAPLKELSVNYRAAVRAYRKYLAVSYACL